MEKILGFLGFEEPAAENLSESLPPQPRLVKSNVVNLPPARQVRLVIARPYAFEQAGEIGEFLKARQPVLLNLERSEAEAARRLLDFLSGVIYALGGSVQKVSEGIFVLTPPNIEVTHQGDGGEPLPAGSEWACGTK
jgi:cell division inhibitor SepF